MRVERLGDDHDRRAFRCGVDVLDTWFHFHALTGQRQDTARTFVLVADDGAIAGYYSLTMGSVDRADAPWCVGCPAIRFPWCSSLASRWMNATRDRGWG